MIDKKEREIIEQCKVKKMDKEHIDLIVKRMYEESERRNLKFKENETNRKRLLNSEYSKKGVFDLKENESEINGQSLLDLKNAIKSKHNYNFAVSTLSISLFFKKNFIQFLFFIFYFLFFLV